MRARLEEGVDVELEIGMGIAGTRLHPPGPRQQQPALTHHPTQPENA